MTDAATAGERVLANGEQMTAGSAVTEYTFGVFAALRKAWGVELVVRGATAELAAYCRDRSDLGATVLSGRESLPSRLRADSRVRQILRRLYRRFVGVRPQGATLEYVPHHFQEPLSRLPRIVGCFDLHIFDVPWKYQPYRHFLRRFKRNLTSAAAIVTPWRRTFERLPSFMPAVAERMFRVEHPCLIGNAPVDAAVLAGIRARYPASSRGRLLLYPAQLQQHKNHKNLISAVALLRRAGQDLELVCPGADYATQVTAEIKRHAEEQGVADAVHFPGFVSCEEIRALYDASTAVVSASLAEGGNLIAQEAILLDRPVACADTEPSRVHVAHMGAHVPLFDPQQPPDIADRIRELFEGAARLVSANKAAKERIAGWTWDQVAARYMQVFRWVREGKRPGSRPPLEPGIQGV